MFFGGFLILTLFRFSHAPPPLSLSSYNSEMAVAGCRKLAQEVIVYWTEGGRSTRPLTLILPGGTCSTAALLHRSMKDILSTSINCNNLDIQVVVVPCVGDEGYARRQIMSLYTQIGYDDVGDIPYILPPSPTTFTPYFGQTSLFSMNETTGYYTFGEPNADILAVHNKMKNEYNVVLDLLYGSPAWTILLRHWRHMDDDPSSPISSQREFMYIHS